MSEKRSFFRVNHDIVFEYEMVDAFTAEEDKPDNVFPDSASLTLFTEFRKLDSESANILREINENNRHIAEYLAFMNRKIDLMAQQMVASQQSLSTSTTPINISEGGLAFTSEKPVYKGCYICVRMVFSPSYVGLVTFAKVIRCDATTDNHYQIAVKFHRMEEAQRQILSRQVIQAQLEDKRKLKDSS